MAQTFRHGDVHVLMPAREPSPPVHQVVNKHWYELSEGFFTPRVHGHEQTLNEQYRREKALAQPVRVGMNTLYQESLWILNRLRAFLWPRSPRKGPYLYLPLALCLLPSMYFLSLLIATQVPECYNLARQTLNTTDVFGPILSGSVPFCTGAVTEQSWGAYVVGDKQYPIRWLTYSLYHVSTEHLFGNVFMLVLLLLYLEPRYGFFHTSMIVLGGITSLIIFSEWQLKPGTVVLGASGASYGLVAALLSDVVVNAHWVKMPRFQIFFSIILAIGVLVNNALGEPGVDSIGHIGSYFGTLGATLMFLPRFVIAVPKDEQRKWLWLRGIGPLIVGLGLVIFIFVVLPIKIEN